MSTEKLIITSRTAFYVAGANVSCATDPKTIISKNTGVAANSVDQKPCIGAYTPYPGTRGIEGDPFIYPEGSWHPEGYL